jgi:hypothetical protein
MGSEAIQPAGVTGWERKRTAVEYCVLRLRRRVSGAGLYDLWWVIQDAAVVALVMVTRRRLGSGSASRGGLDAHTSSVPRAPRKVRTRTSLVGMTIYQPDVEPSPQGRKLLDALDSTYQLTCR